MALHLGSAEAAMIDREVEALDPRVSPFTGEFLQHLSPETSLKIAEFYQHHAKAVLETVVCIRLAINHLEQTAGTRLDQSTNDYLSDLLLNLSQVKWSNGMYELMDSLQGFSDEGLHNEIMCMIDEAQTRLWKELAPEGVR